MSEQFTDWLGQPIEIGDHLLYPAGSGRSITMVLAKLVRIHDNGSVTVEPVKASRWKQHYGRTRYIDTRTGKGIDPFRDPHIADGGYKYRTDTGERVTEEEEYQLIRSRAMKWSDFSYKTVEFKDYVQRVDQATTAVHISVVENITKWTGELP